MKTKSSIRIFKIIPIVMALSLVFMTCVMSASAAATWKTQNMTAHRINANSTMLYWHAGSSYFPARPSGINGGSYQIVVNSAAIGPSSVGHSRYSNGNKTVARVLLNTTKHAVLYPNPPTFTYRVYCMNGSASKVMNVKSGSISASIW
jgi:hypothetical protein